MEFVATSSLRIDSATCNGADMKVALKRKDDIAQYSSWSVEKRNSYSSLISSLNTDLHYSVHCLLFIDKEIVFLVGLEHGESTVNLCSSDFFDITENQLPSSWRFFSRQKNFNMIFHGLRFDTYAYLGFPEFVAQHDFLELLYDDDPWAIAILKQHMKS
jgi:hypothetical protein